MKTWSSLLLATLLAACESVPEPYELDHSRVMAVRAEPPAIASDERARIDVLVTYEVGGPRVAEPDEVTVRAPADVPVVRDENGWYIECPASLARVVNLWIAVDTGTASLTAQKTIELGAHAANPEAPVILHDGEPGTVDVDAQRDVMLATDPPPDDDSLSFRWFSSVGDVVGYTRSEARLKPSRGTSGQIWLVVRDQAGGTAWSSESATVAP